MDLPFAVAAPFAIGAIFSVIGSALPVLYKALRTWIEGRSGRKIKLKVGEVELEASALDEEAIRKLLQFIKERENQRESERIRRVLLEPGDTTRRGQ